MSGCGAGWTNSYNLHLFVNPAYRSVTLYEGKGRTSLHTDASGASVPPTGMHDTLVKNDSDSERTGVTEASGDTVSWGYDHLHRLTSEVRTGTNSYNYSYTLDNPGNRSTWVNNVTLASTSYSYDNANHMTAAGSTSYGFDNDGNRTSAGGTTFSFDYEDRLTGIGSSVSYDYIGASTDRFSKTVSGTTTKFLYDRGNVTEEMQGTTITADYGANAEKLSGTVYWMLQDGQPSTRQLLNSSQAIVASYINDSFGNSVSSSGTAANPFKWNGGSGYYSDAESGLQKVGARYYDPSVGSWISQDVLLVAGGPADSQAVNRYLYCGADPVENVDQSGHDSPGVLIGVGITGFTLVLIYEAYVHYVAGKLDDAVTRISEKHRKQLEEEMKEKDKQREYSAAERQRYAAAARWGYMQQYRSRYGPR